MLERLKNKRNLKQGEIDGYDHKMRRIGLNVRCSRCKIFGHNISTCKVPPSHTSQATQSSWPIQATLANQATQQLRLAKQLNQDSQLREAMQRKINFKTEC